jgi:hypothetical protein
MYLGDDWGTLVAIRKEGRKFGLDAASETGFKINVHT